MPSPKKSTKAFKAAKKKKKKQKEVKKDERNRLQEIIEKTKDWQYRQNIDSKTPAIE